jgi:hypothetical protein
MSTQATEYLMPPQSQMIPASEVAMSQTIAVIEGFPQWAEERIQELQTAPDEHLILVMQGTETVIKWLFLMRGAVATIAAERIKARKGSLGKELAAIAHQIGISPSVFDEDRSIFKTFGVDGVKNLPELTREHFRMALAAPDPHEAIELAATKKAENQSYSTKDFYQDVQDLKGGQSIEKVSEGRWVHAKVSDEAGQALDALVKRRDQPAATVIEQCLIEAMDNRR